MENLFTRPASWLII